MLSAKETGVLHIKCDGISGRSLEHKKPMECEHGDYHRVIDRKEGIHSGDGQFSPFWLDAGDLGFVYVVDSSNHRV